MLFLSGAFKFIKGRLSTLKTPPQGTIIVTNVDNRLTQLDASGTASALLVADKTVTASGTNGAQTINKPAGSVNFAIGATSVVVTNSLVNTNSLILATVNTNDSTLKTVLAVAANGSFTLTGNAAATAATRVAWMVI